MTKTCRACKKTKPATAFSPSAKCKQGLTPDCKDCRNAARRKTFVPTPFPKFRLGEAWR